MQKLDKDKKITLILTGIIIFLLGLILGIIIEREKYQIESKYNFLVETKECNEETKEYTVIGDEKVYLYCLEDVKIKDNNYFVSLNAYLVKNNLEKVIEKLELVETLNDGGSKVYQDDSITLVKCNNLEGNYNTYISSSKNIEVKELCNEIMKNKEFTRTYKIEKILEHDEEDKKYLLLKEYQGDVELVIIETKDKLKEGKNYEFTFNLYDTNIEDNIENIFKNSEILKIKETNKTGNKQIKESFK